jgi:hypothetical protein
MASRVLSSLGVVHEADVQLTQRCGTLNRLAGLCQWLSSICRGRLVVFREVRQLLAQLRNQAQDIFLVRVFGPSVFHSSQREWIVAPTHLLKSDSDVVSRSATPPKISWKRRIPTYRSPSSSSSTTSTYLRCSEEFAKPLVLRSHEGLLEDTIGRGGQVDSMTAL